MGAVKEDVAGRKRAQHHSDDGAPQQHDNTHIYGARDRHFVPLHSSSSLNLSSGSPQDTNVHDEMGQEYTISYTCSSTLRLLRAADLPLSDLGHVYAEYLSQMGVVESESAESGQEHQAESESEAGEEYSTRTSSPHFRDGDMYKSEKKYFDHGEISVENASAYDHSVGGDTKGEKTDRSHVMKKNAGQQRAWERMHARVASMHPLPSSWRRSGKLMISTLTQESDTQDEAETNSEGPNVKSRGAHHRERDTRALITSARVGENAHIVTRMLSDMSSAKKRMDKARMFLDLAQRVREDPALAVILQDRALSRHAHWSEKIVCIDTLVAADREDAQHALLSILHVCDAQARTLPHGGTDHSTEQDDDAAQAPHGSRSRRARHPQGSARHCPEGLEPRVLHAIAGVTRPSHSFLHAFYKRATSNRDALFSLAKLLRHTQEQSQAHDDDDDDDDGQGGYGQDYSRGQGQGQGHANAVTLCISKIHRHVDSLRKKRQQSQGAAAHTARDHDTRNDVEFHTDHTQGKYIHDGRGEGLPDSPMSGNIHHSFDNVDAHEDQEHGVRGTMHDIPSDEKDDIHAENSESEHLNIHDYTRALLIIHGRARPEQIHAMLRDAHDDEKLLLYRELESANMDFSREITAKALLDVVRSEKNRDVRRAGMHSVVRLDEQGHALEDVLQLVEEEPSLASVQVSMYFHMMMINDVAREDVSERIRALPSFQVIHAYMYAYIHVSIHTCMHTYIHRSM
jgi:hypothetical protein